MRSSTTGGCAPGDVGTVDPDGYIQITDRAKDVINSGGGWISSVELENHLMADPAIREAAVIGVPDPRWTERPLACVVVAEEAALCPEELRASLERRVARWQVPELWAFVAEIPKTSVGKFDKKVLRASHEPGELDVRTRRVAARLLLVASAQGVGWRAPWASGGRRRR